MAIYVGEPEHVYRRKVFPKVDVRRVTPEDHQTPVADVVDRKDSLFTWLTARGCYSLSIQHMRNGTALYTAGDLEFHTGDYLVYEGGEITAYVMEAFLHEFERDA